VGLLFEAFVCDAGVLDVFSASLYLYDILCALYVRPFYAGVIDLMSGG
jgi:hypothetical protein